MKAKLLTILTLTFGLVLAISPIAAQQSLADRYDTKKTVTLVGTVTRMWFAPNTPFWIALETKEKGGNRNGLSWATAWPHSGRQDGCLRPRQRAH